MAIKKPLVMYDGLFGLLKETDNIIDSETNSIAKRAESIASFDPQITKTLYVDVNRTDTYVENGQVNKPFKSINSAINKIIENNDNTLNPYNIFIQTGKYYETVIFEDLKLHRITLVGNGTVQIRPTSNESIRSVANNTNLKAFHLKNITLLAPIVITGSNGSTAFDDVIWDNCNFVPGDGSQKGTLNLTCINNFSTHNAFFYNCNMNLNNVNYCLIKNSSIGSGSVLNISMDSSLSVPSWGHQGGVSIMTSNLTGTPTLTISGTNKAYNLQLNSTRIAGNSSNVTIPDGLTVTAYNSFLHGNWTNQGNLYLRNSVVQNLSGNITGLDQFGSQLNNDSNVDGNTIKDALNDLLEKYENLSIAVQN